LTAPAGAWRRAAAAFSILFLAIAVPWTLLHADRAASLVHGDAAGYWRAAVTLARHGVFSETPAPNFFPVSHRTPGYPWVLAQAFRLFGERLPVAVWLNVALLAVQGLAVLDLARSMRLAPAAAAAAALLVAAHPLALHWSQQVYTDTMFSTGLALALALWFRGRESGAATMGAIAIAAALPLVRPVALYALPLWGALLLWRGRRSGRRVLCGALLPLLAAPSLVWCARNERLFGDFYFCEIGAWNLRHGHALAVQAEAGAGSYGELWAKSFREEAGYLFRPVESPMIPARRWRSEAIAIFREHPALTAWVTARNVFDLYETSLGDVTMPFPPAGVSPPPPTRYPGTLGFLGEGRFGAPRMALGSMQPWQRPVFWAAQAEHALTAAMLALAGWGGVLALRHAPVSAAARVALVQAAFWLMQTMLSLPAGEFTAPRFRLPIHVVLVPLALWALASRRGVEPDTAIL
jgi:4-amino-4-deoxy-L-arabinose transferase-like glycosyltransferase